MIKYQNMWKYCVLLLCLSGYCLAGPVNLKRNKPVASLQQRANDANTSIESMAESETVSSATTEVESSPAEMMVMSTLTLPSNATSIRADIVDNFSCQNKTYGYYADVENDCQIFHVCLPVTYADGKENTFRWSFICPEETVFSQDSFTCMRPEDMTISCEESLKYYDLNSNFGMIEPETEEKDNEMSAAAPENEVSKPAMEIESQPETMKPLAEVTKPMEAEDKPVKVQKPNRRKPGTSYASQKKPTKTVPLRKMPQAQKPINEVSENQAVENVDVIEPVEQADNKPVVQKFSRRPAPAASTTFKDKMESLKPAIMTAIRTDIYNQKRKRPTMFNKKPLETVTTDVKIENEPAKEISQAAEENLEQNFSQILTELSNESADSQVADTETQATQTQEVFVKPEHTIMAEVEPQTSEAEKPTQVLEAFEEIPAVIAEVMETEDTPKIEEEITQVVKTAEELQGVSETQVVEEVETGEKTESSMETDGVNKTEEAEENQAGEETQSAEEVVQSFQQPQMAETQVAESEVVQNEVASSEIAQSIEEQQPIEGLTAEEPQMVETAQATLTVDETKPIETTEIVDETMSVEEAEIPDETRSSAEKQENELVLEQESIDVDQPLKETLETEVEQSAENVPVMQEVETAEQPIIVEEQIPVEEVKQEETEQMKETVNVEAAPEVQEEQAANIAAEPAIFEANSEETAAPVQTIEEMEAEKPAEAPESVSANEQMPEQNPMVQEMFEETLDEDKKQTIGGFKPVDPVMAAEAEQLIADFINTLRKNDFTNETPGMPMRVTIDEENAVSGEEASKSEEVPVVMGQVEEVKETEELASQPQIFEAQSSSEENKAVETEVVQQAEEATNVAAEIEAEKNADSNEVSFLKSSEIQSSETNEDINAMPAQNLIMPQMPHDIYQIPVQVITAPMEETPSMSLSEEPLPPNDSSAADAADNTEENNESESPSMIMTGYKPLSIDDIVELVKERLDHMPKNEMETPMQLEQVLSEAKPESEDVAELVAADENPSQEMQQSEEEIVMPIYNRLAEPTVVDAAIQTESAESLAIASDDNVADSKPEKSNRSYRSRSMLSAKLDPRKRRFLFRADAS